MTIDAQVSTMSNLTNAANSMILCVQTILTCSFTHWFSPPMSIYSWKPSLFLPITPRIPEDVEEGKATASEQPDNELDMHVEDVLKFVLSKNSGSIYLLANRRQDKFRRTMKGIGSFLKTRTLLYRTSESAFTVISSPWCTHTVMSFVQPLMTNYRLSLLSMDFA